MAAISKLAGSVSSIGDVLSHTAKSNSRNSCERVMDTLREIDFLWHLEGDCPLKSAWLDKMRR